MKNKVKLLISMLFVFCLFFSCGIIFVNYEANASSGIFVGGGANVNISGGLVTDNNKAIVITDGEHTIKNLTITGSTNGAIHIADNAKLTIKNCTIDGNSNSSDGGAIFVGNNATLIIEDSIIKNNIATGNGGAIFASANSRVTITGNSIISGNSAKLGGGIYLVDGAFANDGNNIMEYCKNNVSTINTDVWQSVYYEKVNIGIYEEYEEIIQPQQYDSTYKIENFNLDWIYQDLWSTTDDENLMDVMQFKSTDAICNILSAEGQYDIQFFSQSKIELIEKSTFYQVKAKHENITGVVKIPKSFKGKEVKQVVSKGFANCSGITSVIIPETINYMYSRAFYNCTGLTAVHVNDVSAWAKISLVDILASPLYYAKYLYINGELATDIEIKGVTGVNYGVFYNCHSIKNVTICEGVEKIGQNAFYSCNGLKSISIPSTITSLGIDIMRGCSRLENIIFKADMLQNFNSSMGGISSLVEGYNLTLGDNIVEIPDQLFESSTKLLSVQFESNASKLERIGDRAFYGCTNLKQIQLPTALNYIGERAFYSCTQLNNITIPENLENIRDYTFFNCAGLSELNLNDNLLHIGNYAFAQCRNIQEIVLPVSLLSVGEQAFINVQASFINNAENFEHVGEKAFYNCDGLTSFITNAEAPFVAPYAFAECDNLETFKMNNASGDIFIYEYTFSNCKNLTTVSISNSFIISVEEFAFQNCSSLESFDFNDKLTSVGKCAFYNCSSLTGQIRGKNIKSIGTQAFYNCSNISAIYIENEDIEFGTDVFSGCSKVAEIYSDANIVSRFYTVFTNVGKGVDGTTLILGKNNAVIPSNFANASSYPRIKSLEFSDNCDCVEIGTSAFAAYSYLEKLILPSTILNVGEKAFYNCDGLTDLTINEGITTIGKQSFYDCDGLTSLTLPESITTFGSKAFAACSYVTEMFVKTNAISDFKWVFETVGSSADGIVLTLGKNISQIPADFLNVAKSNYVPKVSTIVFEEGSTCKSVGEYAFYKNSGIKKVHLPASINTIYMYAFGNCNMLNEVTVLGSPVIGSSAFGSCSRLAKVNITSVSDWLNATFENVSSCPTYHKGGLYINGEPVTSIEYADYGERTTLSEYNFAGCSTLKNVVIPSSITSIGRMCFLYCEYIETIYYNSPQRDSINENLYDNTDYVFRDVGIYADNCLLIIGADVVQIPAYTFEGAKGITSIDFSDSIYLEAIGVRAFYLCEKLASLDLSCVTTLEKLDTSCFAYCYALTEAYLPSSVESISAPLFSACELLTTLTIEEGGIYTSRNSNNSKEVNAIINTNSNTLVIGTSVTEIPEYISTIGEYAFFRMYSLTSITIPDSVTAIGNNAFCYCMGIEGTLTLPNNLTTIGEYAFYNCSGFTGTLTISSNVTEIGNNAFNGCSKISKLVYKGNVGLNTYSGDPNIFAGMVADVVIEANSVPNYFFFEENKLKSVSFSGTKTIGQHAFYGCSGFTGVLTIPSSVTQIGNYAFNGCSSFSQINYNANIAIDAYGYMPYIFYGIDNGGKFNVRLEISSTVVPDYLFYGSEGISYVSMPQVKTIGNYAFDGCSAITIIKASTNLKTIGDYAFRSCSNLAELDCGNQQGYAFETSASIGNHAFENCTSLQQLLLRGSIGEYAFKNCISLYEVRIENGVTRIGRFAFIYEDFDEYGYEFISLIDINRIWFYNEYFYNLWDPETKEYLYINGEIHKVQVCLFELSVSKIKEYMMLYMMYDWEKA